MTSKSTVPKALRTWFVIHFIIDIAFAIPLMISPEIVLSFVGWKVVDPFAARLVAAALFGIGVESWLGRNAPIENFRGMINLKLIWSFAAMVAIASTIMWNGFHTVFMAWVILITFFFFHLLWWYWKMRITPR